MSELARVDDGQADGWPVLLARFLATKESANTRDAYRRDLTQWAAWCQAQGGHPLDASETAVAAWSRQLQGMVANTTRARKLTVLSSFYGWCVKSGVLAANPVAGLDRPTVDYSTSMTPGLTADQARSLVHAADDWPAPGRLRASALVALLVFSGVRISEALSADVEDLATDRGHRTLKVHRKGGKVQSIALPAPVVGRIEDYLRSRSDVSDAVAVLGEGGRPVRRPLFATSTGGRFGRREAHRLIGTLARAAGLAEVGLSPHGLRHTAITLALDAGAQLRDVQAMAGHADPKTTLRYDRARGNLDRSPAYLIAQHLAN